MNLHLLNLLIEKMKTVSEKEFNMETFGKKTECGTTMCIAGHATTIPEFQALGLELYQNWMNREGEFSLRIPNKFGFYINEYAIAKALEISAEDAFSLFIDSMSWIKTPSDAILMLEKYRNGIHARECYGTEE